MAYQPGGVDGQPSAESSYELPLQGEVGEIDGAADDGEDEEEVADMFGDFDAEGPPDDGLPVPILDGDVIDATCANNDKTADAPYPIKARRAVFFLPMTLPASPRAAANKKELNSWTKKHAVNTICDVLVGVDASPVMM